MSFWEGFEKQAATRASREIAKRLFKSTPRKLANPANKVVRETSDIPGLVIGNINERIPKSIKKPADRARIFDSLTSNAWARGPNFTSEKAKDLLNGKKYHEVITKFKSNHKVQPDKKPNRIFAMLKKKKIKQKNMADLEKTKQEQASLDNFKKMLRVE